MKKLLSTFLLALVALTTQAQKAVVWENPSTAYSDIPYFAIQKVELTKEKTTMFVNMRLLPGYTFQIRSDCYLKAQNKQYVLNGCDSIPLNTWITMDDSGMKDFILNFKPLPLDTKEFDFIEGLAANDYKVFGVHDKNYVMPAAIVPAEYIPSYTEKDQLAELKYDTIPATIHFKSLNYRKGMNTEITVQYVDLKNPAKPVDVEIHLNDNGEASVSLPIGLPQIVHPIIFNVPWSSMAFVYLAPGKEVTLLIDMLHDDTSVNTKFVGYKGYFAKFDKDHYQTTLEEQQGLPTTPFTHELKEMYEQKMFFSYDFVTDSKDMALSDARGFKADLARYCYYMPQVLDGKSVEKPRIEDKYLSALYDKYVAEHRQTVAAQKEGLPANAHYLDMTEIAPENILQTILDRYKGKTVLVDLWATWCGPCKLGHEKMKPLKQELSEKDIVYVYITSPTSKYDEWKEYVTGISGEHYFLTDEQYRYITKQYEVNGIPTYIIYNAKGEQTFKQEGFLGIEPIKEALEKVLNIK